MTAPDSTTPAPESGGNSHLAAYHDARRLAPDTVLTTDVAVIGGGIAGLTVVRGLQAAGLNVMVLESGGRGSEPACEALNHGHATLYDAYGNQREFNAFMHESRCRYLGGCGHLWGGKSAELDPVDFEARRWLDHSGWPFGYDDLKPYFDRACGILEIPPFHRHAPVYAGNSRAPLIINRERTLTTGLRRYSAIAGRADAQRYQAFVDTTCRLPRVTTVLYATALSLLPDTHGRDVQQICRLQCISTGTIGNGNGSAQGQGRCRRFQVQAKYFVLAAGGLENPRLLLQSTHAWPEGLGNAHDQVGRYFLGHTMHRCPNADSKPFTFKPHCPPSQLQLYIDKTPSELQGVLQLTRRAQKRERVPNNSFTLDAPVPVAAAHSNAHAPLPTNLHAGSCTSGAGIPPRLTGYFMVEQAPYPDSRVRLSAAAQHSPDPLGQRPLVLEWYFQPRDIAALQRCAALMAEELQRHGVGELHHTIDPRYVVPRLLSARHHMGTTRISEDPRHGVVDAHCRVHGSRNVFIAGASVFPTGGVANPTLGIMALALRLADHLIALAKTGREKG